MAKEHECPFYKDCGFVKWRKENPLIATPLPEDGDCGRASNRCPRVQSKCTLPPFIKKVDYDSYGPQTREEFDIAMPPNIEDSNGKPRHRILGGVDK